jgi:hypothetical protein
LIINIIYVFKTPTTLKTIFGKIPDFRRSLKQLYDLESILLIGVISVICGADSWNEIESYANSKEKFLIERVSELTQLQP